LIITPFIPKIISMFGKKNVFQFCGVFTIVGGVGLFFTPANMFWLVLLTLAIKGDVVWQEPATTGPAGSDLD
jgi:glucuronide carrier protein